MQSHCTLTKRFVLGTFSLFSSSWLCKLPNNIWRLLVAFRNFLFRLCRFIFYTYRLYFNSNLQCRMKLISYLVTFQSSYSSLAFHLRRFCSQTKKRMFGVVASVRVMTSLYLYISFLWINFRQPLMMRENN